MTTRTTETTPEARSRMIAAAVLAAADELQKIGGFAGREMAAGTLTAAAELLVAAHGRDAARRILVAVSDVMLDVQTRPAH
jgi:hypothetical protein